MPNFEKILDHLRDRFTDLFGMGHSFERLGFVDISIEPDQCRSRMQESH